MAAELWIAEALAEARAEVDVLLRSLSTTSASELQEALRREMELKNVLLGTLPFDENATGEIYKELKSQFHNLIKTLDAAIKQLQYDQTNQKKEQTRLCHRLEDKGSKLNEAMTTLQADCSQAISLNEAEIQKLKDRQAQRDRSISSIETGIAGVRSKVDSIELSLRYALVSTCRNETNIKNCNCKSNRSWESWVV
eukprot:TRINITY_DN11168_c0_g1_i10.p2 TRINITY_DN11168_c0_g1~~TRINITY_DN11168_c0_g1_i10.p2  ORF type:complete len:196 (+),score=34.43 TRINITY_DN11168_c0_g1_i10:1174-1761(+)